MRTTLLVAIAALLRPEATAADATPTVPAGFAIETIARVAKPRELVTTPSGDLLIGSGSDTVYIVSNALERPGPARAFLRLPDSEAAGIALGPNALYVGTNRGVWRTPYKSGDRSAVAAPQKIATVRPGGGRGHSTTSVAVSGTRLFASVGSSCNACEESDTTRASVQVMDLDGRGMRAKATHIRNAIALAAGPGDSVYAGVAGQDELQPGHPYEIFDDVGSRSGTANYGWPTCYENRRAVSASNDCAAVTVPSVVFPAYSTPIGAAFYDPPPRAVHAFPNAYRGGVFVALHGSWHKPPVAPRVVFVAMEAGKPATPVDWSDPSKQWRPFVDGFARPGEGRIGRPTGVAVASDGSLFVADDYANCIYRIRPATKP